MVVVVESSNGATFWPALSPFSDNEDNVARLRLCFVGSSGCEK